MPTKPKKPKTTAPFTERPICNLDMAELRDRLGLGTLDFVWQMGAINRKWRVSGSQAQEPIANPSMTLLVRYLMHRSKEQFVPKMPSATDVHRAIEGATGEELSSRRFGAMFGCGQWSGARWLNGGGVASPVVERLFYLVFHAIQEEGEKGLKRFLNVVDEEARARGISGGLEELLRSAMWGAYLDKEE